MRSILINLYKLFVLISIILPAGLYAEPPESTRDELLGIKTYTINLMWINKSFDASQEYISNAKDEDAFERKVLDSVSKWALANPSAEVNFWYDGAYIPPRAIENSQRALETKLQSTNLKNVRLKDIREIPVVQKNPGPFSEQLPLYFRVDLLKAIIIVDSIERNGNDAAVYTDLEVGDLRPDQQRMGKDELFRGPVTKELAQYGLIIGGSSGSIGRENQFLQLVKNSRMIEAMKYAIINANIVRAVTALNQPLKSIGPLPNREMALTQTYAGPLFSTIADVFAYYQATTPGSSIKVHRDAIGQTQNKWVDYDPKEHGYSPFGVFMDIDGHEGITLIQGKWKSTSEMLTLPSRYPVPKRDVKVRPGRSHVGEYTFLPGLPGPPETDIIYHAELLK